MGLQYIESFNQNQQRWYAERTGIFVDIQNIGKNTNLIAIKEKPSLQQIQPGVWLKKGVIRFKDGNFSNIYDLFWKANQSKIIPSIDSSNKPYSLYDKIENDPSIISIINGSYFFLTDIANRKPHNLPYDFCVRDGIIIGLPAENAPIAFIKGKKLYTKEPNAKGVLKISRNEILWVGAKYKFSPYKKGRDIAVLYNSNCANIIKLREESTGLQIGILDNGDIKTPINPEVFDLVVCLDKRGKLRISRINKGGGTHFYTGAFILQMKGDSKKYKIGSLVKPISLDKLNLQTISSGITIGRKVTDPYFLKTERANKRDARSILAKDVKGNMHFIVLDGSKYVPGFNGVSVKDINNLFSLDKYKWAYFLDGGGSSRIIVKEDGELGIFANQFAFKKLKNGKLLWDWRKARKLATSLSLRVSS